MSRHRVAGGLPVRGTCADGHVTEATTDPGRVTWEGECAHDGCARHVKARDRIRPAAPAADSPASPATPPDTPAQPVPAPPASRLRKVDYDAAPRKRDQPRRPAKRTPATPAAPVQPDQPGGPGGDSEPGGGVPAGGSPVDDGRRATVRERITGRRKQAEDRPRSETEFRLTF